jgi:hypothetical protein
LLHIDIGLELQVQGLKPVERDILGAFDGGQQAEEFLERALFFAYGVGKVVYGEVKRGCVGGRLAFFLGLRGGGR